MQVQDTASATPLFMKQHDLSLQSDVRPVAGRDHRYDAAAQRSDWFTDVRAGSGYHTQQGGDWTKTDEV